MKTSTKAILSAAALAVAVGGFWAVRSQSEGKAKHSRTDSPKATEVSVFLRVGDQASTHALPNLLELVDQFGKRLSVNAHVVPSSGDSYADALARCATAQDGAKAVRFVVCRQSMGQGNEDWSACAEESRLDKSQLDACAKGPEGAKLALAASDEAKERQVATTPTFFVAGSRVEGDGTREALKRALCDALTPEPAACSEGPTAEASGLPILVFTDSRCSECRAPFWFRRMQMLFPNADVRIIDVQTGAGRAQYDELAPGLLPAIAIDPGVESEPGFERIQRELVKKGEQYFLSPGTIRPTFDPAKHS